MSYQLRVSEAAQKDLERLFEFLAANDLSSAIRARKAIEAAYELVEFMPFACRKADESTPFLREAIIPFGSTGYVVLFEVENNKTVTVLAVRHQLEDDFH